MTRPVFTRQQLVHTVTKHTDFTKPVLLRNVILFHGRHVNVISFTTVRKVRSSLLRFSRNSCMSNSNMRRSPDTEFHPNRTINAVSTDRLHLRRLSLCRFSRNSKSLNVLLWKSRILIFFKNRITNYKTRQDFIYVFQQTKCGSHCTDIHDSHTALYTDLLYRISLRSVKKYGKWGRNTFMTFNKLWLSLSQFSLNSRQLDDVLYSTPTPHLITTDKKSSRL